MKVKLKCNACGKYFYWDLGQCTRKCASKFKKASKISNDASLEHWLLDKCEVLK